MHRQSKAVTVQHGNPLDKLVLAWKYEKLVWTVCPGLHSNNVILVHDKAHNFLQSSLGNAGPSSVVLIWHQAVFTRFPTSNEQLSQCGFTCDKGVPFNFPAIGNTNTQWTRSGSKGAQLCSSLTSAPDGGEWSAQCTGSFTSSETTLSRLG
jgi:hypothetical protein